MTLNSERRPLADGGNDKPSQAGAPSDGPRSKPLELDEERTLMDTVSDPDPDIDPAREIEESGEPFEGNHA